MTYVWRVLQDVLMSAARHNNGWTRPAASPDGSLQTRGYVLPTGGSGRYLRAPLVVTMDDRRISEVLGLALIRQGRGNRRDPDFAVAAFEILAALFGGIR